MARVLQLVIQPEHKPGALAAVCSELAKKAVNITAILAAPNEREGIRIVATPHQAARSILQTMQLPFHEEEAIAVRLGDKPGALGKITRKLADADVNITYAYGSIVKGEQRALIILGVSDLKKADEVV